MAGILQTLNNLTYSREKLSDGRIQITIEVSNERFEKVKNRVYQRLAPTIKIDGFRPGTAPKNVTMARLGPTLFEQTLGELIPSATLEVIKKEELIPLDQISYKVEKVAEGSGVKYTATFTIFPDFKLPDFSKIEVDKKKVDVTEKEMEDVIKQIYNQRKVKGEKGDKKKEKKEKIDDKWVESLNMGVSTLKDLKKKIKEELTKQKKMNEENRFIYEILKKVSEKSEFDVPEVLIEKELQRREEEYKGRISKLGMKLEDFLKSQKTTLSDLKKSWKKEAEERIKTEIIMIKVANSYNIKVGDKEVTEYVEKIKDKKIRKQYENQSTRKYLQSVLLRQRVVNKILQLVSGKDKK